MKTKILTVVLTLATLLTFIGCGKDSPSKATTTADTASIAAAIKDNVAMVDGLVLVETERNAENAYPGVLDMVPEYTIYVNATGGYAEEIAVFRVKDGVSTAELEPKMNERIEYQKMVFEDYQPREMPKLADPVIYTTNDLVIMVVSDNSSIAKTSIESALN